MKYTHLIFIILFLFSSCRKEKKEAPPQKPIWKEIGDFWGRDKILINSVATEDMLCLYGIGRITQITDPNDDGNFSFKNWGGFNYTDIMHKPLLHPDFFLSGINNLTFTVKATQSHWGNPSFAVNLKSFDSSIMDFDKVEYWEGDFFKGNNAKQMLIPIRKKNEGNAFILATLRMPHKEHIEWVYLKQVSLPGVWQFWPYLHNIDDNFFVSSGEKRTFKINTDGIVTEVASNIGIRRMFKHDPDTLVSGNEIYYGITEGDRIVKSRNYGESWEYFSQDVIGGLSSYQFNNYDGQIIGYHSSLGIIHLVINGNEILFNSIDTKGLEGQDITSISKFKNHFFVTTFSGCFKKSVKEFFTYKEK